jgi:hypothetical protein
MAVSEDLSPLSDSSLAREGLVPRPEPAWAPSSAGGACRRIGGGPGRVVSTVVEANHANLLTIIA